MAPATSSCKVIQRVRAGKGWGLRNPRDQRVDNAEYWFDIGTTNATKHTSVGVKPASHPGRALTVLEGGALSDLDDITVRIADVAARLAVLWYRFRDELSASTLP